MPPILRKPIQCSKASDGYKRGIGIAVEWKRQSKTEAYMKEKVRAWERKRVCAWK